jgi:thiamine biosynthesis protein ThiS
MDVVVNGKPRSIEAGATVGDLVSSLGFSARRVVVERNGEAVERARFDSLELHAGDVLEIVRPVQGGSL